MDPKPALPYVDADGDYDEDLDPAIHDVRRRGALLKARIDAYGGVARKLVFEVALVVVMASLFAAAAMLIWTRNP